MFIQTDMPNIDSIVNAGNGIKLIVFKADV